MPRVANRLHQPCCACAGPVNLQQFIFLNVPLFRYTDRVIQTQTTVTGHSLSSLPPASREESREGWSGQDVAMSSQTQFLCWLDTGAAACHDTSDSHDRVGWLRGIKREAQRYCGSHLPIPNLQRFVHISAWRIRLYRI